jgi:hypothetical protein
MLGKTSKRITTLKEMAHVERGEEQSGTKKVVWVMPHFESKLVDYFVWYVLRLLCIL